MDIVIVSASRTPIGKFLGSLSSLSAPQLGAAAIKAALKKAWLKPIQVDEVIMGNSLQAGIGQNPARQAAIKAGLPKSTAAFTVNKVCGSGLKAVLLAAQSIQSSENQIVIAGGMESMSQAPHLLLNGRKIKKFGNISKKELAGKDFILTDSMIHDGLVCSFNACHMGNLAELAGKKYRISREEQDAFSLESHQKALRADFSSEITRVHGVSRDEGPRKDTSLEKMSQLRTVFDKRGSITAANASQLSDGASALVITSANHAKKLGLKPLARIEDWAEASQEPEWYTTAPVAAVRKLMKKTRHKLADFDLIELNEAYAVQSLAVVKELNISMKKLNIKGGAIALGHPIGCTGARIVTTLVHSLMKGQLGLATLCIGGGEAIAMSVKGL